MDDLIFRKAAIDQAMGKLDYTDVVFDIATEFEIVYMLRSLPSVPAVPLDKLCEWLERYATMDCDGCREAFGSCEDTEPSVCNSRERWKAMLTKWMEGLDGSESVVQKT